MTNTPSSTQRPDVETVQRASALFDLIRSEAAQGQEDRQVTKTVTDAVDGAGLFNLMVPTRLGGPGASARTMIEVLIELGRADGSTGWSAALVNACTWFAVTYSEQAQREIWGAHPKAKACGIFFPGMTRRHQLGTGEKVEGGYLLTGEYPYASGNAVADWATLGMLVDGPDGTPTMALGLVEAKDWTVKDTWFTLGMRGTGSNTLVVKDAYVPDHRIQTFDDLARGNYATPYARTEPASRASFLPVGTVILAAPAIGLAKAALDYSLEKLPTRSVGYTVYTEARNSPTHHLAVAQAASNIDAAHLLLARAADDIDAFAAADSYPDERARGRIRMDTGHAVTLCKEAIDVLMTANGAGAFTQDGLLGRIWRDANAAGRHAFATPEIGKEVYGRLLLGADDALTIAV
ncbi:acyl-CoA dehydrogenase family protein [Acrocarpospora catenulata]|uniref:acyl-CoA dehydrogenase family protein n=1 Tax=Acrocarpospora catenulata TaxID=2836182 RepID=UPI001BDA57DB|nr:acyl-CoA dehydrogenase family protein [Acrocarpospora catenulata]